MSAGDARAEWAAAVEEARTALSGGLSQVEHDLVERTVVPLVEAAIAELDAGRTPADVARLNAFLPGTFDAVGDHPALERARVRAERGLQAAASSSESTTHSSPRSRLHPTASLPVTTAAGSERTSAYTPEVRYCLRSGSVPPTGEHRWRGNHGFH